MNYRDESNKADAEAVAEQIRQLGGDAMIVQADMGKVRRER